jgi:lambda repressor-like predicted transcriptional regulator
MSQAWTPPDIKAALTKQGWTLAAIDRQGDEQGPFYNGAARQSLRGGNYRAARVISMILGVPMLELFPGMYLTARPGRPEPVRSGLMDSSHKTVGESRQSRTTAVDSARAA